MINLVTVLTNSYPNLAIKLSRKVAEETDKLGYNIKSSVIADKRKNNPHKKKLNFDGFLFLGATGVKVLKISTVTFFSLPSFKGFE